MSKYTVVVSTKGKLYKICKIWYGSDGSYYVTVPYHSATQAVLIKQSVNYVQSAPTSLDHRYVVPLSEALDVGSSDDARIKLSHHPDGFVQFSGQGLISGKNLDGTSKGIGIYTWPLPVGNSGPAFSLCVQGIEQFTPADVKTQNACVLNCDELTIITGSTGVAIEGHYFQPLWRRFIRTRHDGVKVISIVHPSKVVMELRVLLSADDCPLGGFIGLDFFGTPDREPSDASGYSLSSSTGNVRLNEKGEKVGDGLLCCYPRPDGLPIRRSLDHQPPNSPAAKPPSGPEYSPST